VSAVDVIAANLAALPHPDGSPRQLPGFSARLMPEAMRPHVEKAGREIAESLVHLLELNGFDVEKTEQPEPESVDVLHIHCTLCSARLMSVSLADSPRAATSGPALLSGLAKLRPECPHDSI